MHVLVGVPPGAGIAGHGLGAQHPPAGIGVERREGDLQLRCSLLSSEKTVLRHSRRVPHVDRRIKIDNLCVWPEDREGRRWTMPDIKNQGLEGVVAATTRLSSVDGEAGELLIAGFPVEELAPRASFEETTWLLWNGSLPTMEELEDFRRRLAGRRTLPAATQDLLRAAAQRRVPAMDALRMAAGTLSLIEGGGDPRED